MSPATVPVEQQRRGAQRRYVMSRIVVYAVAILASLLAATIAILRAVRRWEVT